MYLWGHKISGVAGGHEQPVLCPQLLGKAKVGNPQTLGLARRTGVQQIGRLQIPVHHSLFVQVVDRGCLWYHVTVT